MPETRRRSLVVWRSIASVTAAGDGGSGRGILEGIDSELCSGVRTMDVILFVTEDSGSELLVEVSAGNRTVWAHPWVGSRGACFFNASGFLSRSLLFRDFRLHEGSCAPLCGRGMVQAFVVVAEGQIVLEGGLIGAQMVVECDLEFCLSHCSITAIA